MDSSDQDVVSVVKIEIDIAEEPLSWTTQNEENGEEEPDLFLVTTVVVMFV